MNSEATDQTNGDSLEVVILNELIKIDAEQFKGNTEMSSENEIVLHPYNVKMVIGIVIPEMSQYFHFYGSLMMESFLISYYLQSHVAILFVVETTKGLPKRALP